MSVVFWDTNLFVYLVEAHAVYAPMVKRIRRRMLERNDRLCTSAFTLGEVLAGPYAGNDRALANRYIAALGSPSIDIVSFTPEVAEHYARIRVDRSIRPPDAIQLACAAYAQVDLFITNDGGLHRKVIPGIQFITGIDTDVL